ncbi:argininosuccinate lyase [Candidatus Micrarchaeota archaeon]|nr:argininosuccinate lyase [Candidatus Micrarchaeota archaeon]
MLWTNQPVSEKVMAFTVGHGHLLDQPLLPYDIAGTRAHAHALKDVGVLTADENAQVQNALDELSARVQNGTFSITQKQEDSHTAIEEFLTEKLGDTGRRIQAGRSRNDQALTMLRLYAKDQLQQVQDQIRQLQATILAKTKTDYPMPGYTHMQKAMAYSTARWLESFHESLEDDVLVLQAALTLNDQSPLGSAAGFGSSLDLNRQKEAQELGFTKVQNNTLYCQNSRGKIELFTLSALHQVALTLNKLSCDILLYSTTEYGFLQKPSQLCTGSSLMPHKKNPDVMELVRARTAALSAAYAHVAATTQNLPSGYHRDFQETKATLLEAFATMDACLEMTALWVHDMAFDPKKLKAAMTDELHSVNRSLERVKTGTPFRHAYHQEKGESHV